MSPLSVGIHELKSRLRMYLELVQAGTPIVIMDRGKPVGRIIHIGASPEARIQELVQVGLLAWSGRKLTPRTPIVRARGKRTVADLVLEDRPF